MTDTTITFSMNGQELALVKTSVALTLASINRTCKECRDKVSINEDILDDLFKRFDSLQSKLESAGKEQRRKRGARSYVDYRG